MSWLGIAADEPVVTAEQRRWRREIRSAWLRLGVLAILIANLLTGEHGGNLLVHGNVVTVYALATVAVLVLSIARRGPTWLGASFVAGDAMAVVALFHEHFYASSGAFDHALTPTDLAVAFLLLSHVALRLRPGLVLLYAGIVLVGWLFVPAVNGAVSGWDHSALSTLAADGTLAVAFALAAFLAFLIIRDHDVLLDAALGSERRRMNLSRFFSPAVVAELQGGDVAMEMERRMAATMFVDLRSFTRFAESASPRDLAELLVDYREHVAQAVFQWSGTIDKFVGDGVMAVFGHPRARPDDAERAVRCALQLAEVLTSWKAERQRVGKPALDAGIGLHLGPVIGGVLQSGQHDEFTVLGDAVNVSARLEKLAKVLDATLVVSAECLAGAPDLMCDVPWVWKDGVALEGRTALARIAYLPRANANDGSDWHALCMR